MQEQETPVYTVSSQGARSTVVLDARTRFVEDETIDRNRVMRIGRVFDIFSNFKIEENGTVIATGNLQMPKGTWTVNFPDSEVGPSNTERSKTQKASGKGIDGGPDALKVITKALHKVRPSAAPRSTAGSSAAVAILEEQIAKLEALLAKAGIEA